MGNTILAHALYSCNQLDVDLSTFFSDTGNAHKIRLLNKTDLNAWHLTEHPRDDYTCILTVTCRDWSEILRNKLSYTKWYKEYPSLKNFAKFFSYTVPAGHETLWQEFYQNYKDPLWPECATIEQLATLPASIQSEIRSVYQFPSTYIDSEHNLAEWLTVCYYDQFSNTVASNFLDSKTLQLQDYLDGNYSALQEVCTEILGWQWDNVRSNTFHQQAMTANTPYFVWLDNIKAAASFVLNNCPFEFVLDTWEQALIIAYLCNQIGFNPKQIKWNNIDCKVYKNNLYLENFRRTLHGKTI